MKFLGSLVILLAGLVPSAFAQTAPQPTISKGVTWTPAQWVAAWSSKIDTSPATGGPAIAAALLGTTGTPTVLSRNVLPLATQTVPGILSLNNAAGAAPIQSAGPGLTLAGTALGLPTIGTAGNYSNITVDAFGRVTTIRALNTGDINAALGFPSAPAAALAAEVTRAEGVEAGLTTSLATETTRAEGAESTLTTNLAAEVAARQTAVTGETTRAESAEGTLTTNLAAEVTARTTAVAGETTRAEGAESTLTTNLAAEVTARGVAVTGETTRAEAAEGVLTTAVTAAQTTASAALPVVAGNVTVPGVPATGSVGIVFDNEDQTAKLYPFGTWNEAVAASQIVGQATALAQFNGFQTPSQMSLATQLSIGADYQQNISVPPLYTETGGTYTATGYTFATPLSGSALATLQAQLANNAARYYPPTNTTGYPVGPIITLGTYTGAPGTGYYRGNITGVAANGTSLTIGGWYATGNTAAAQVPPAGLTAAIDPEEYTYVRNGVLQLAANGWANSAVYDEGDLYNFKPNGTLLGMSMNCATGVGASGYQCGEAYLALGDFGYGFEASTSSGSTEHPFIYKDGATGTYMWSVASNGSMRSGDITNFDSWTVTPGANGSGNVAISASGPDANVNETHTLVGTGSLIANSPSGHPAIFQVGGVNVASIGATGGGVFGSAAEDSLTLAPGLSGSGNVTITAAGVDANINEVLTPAGTGEVLVQGPLSTTGTLYVTGAATVHGLTDGGALGVTGAATLAGLTNTGTLTETGNATISGTLGVTGALTATSGAFSGALTVPTPTVGSTQAANAAFVGTQSVVSAWAGTGLGYTTAPTATQLNAALYGTTKVVNVVLAGADPTGVADSAPAIRAAEGSNETLFFPPGTYRLASTQTAPCCAYDAPAILMQGYTNFAVSGYGATLVVDSSIAFSTAVQFDSDKNFSVAGLAVQGSRSGLTATQENVGLAFTSDANFVAKDLHLTGNFGGNGAGLAGDWLVNGVFSNITMDTVGHCEDMAFLKNVTFAGQNATGADTNAATGTGQVGQTCFSVINDVPNAATNNTGVSFTETDGVTLTGVKESNFTTGFLISSGTHFNLYGNYWHNNPGLASASTPGLGGYIVYTNGGVATSVGVPPSGISIADTFANNGTAVAGYGLVISTAAITNSDVISGISIANSTFDNNAATAIGSDATTGLSDISVSSTNTFIGAAQTTAINASLTAALASYQVPGSPQNFLSVKLNGNPSGISEYVANNTAIEYANAAGTFAPTIGVSAANVLYLRPGSSAAYTQIQDYGGTSLLQLGDAGIVGANIPVTLANTLGVSGVTTLAGLTNTGTLTETGNQTISGTLGVTGLLTTSAGHANTGALTETGNETVSGTLGVSGATTLAGLTNTGTLTETGNETVSGTLGVTGAATLAGLTNVGTLTETGGETVSSTLGVTGATTLAGLTNTGTLTETGNETVSGTLGVTGAQTGTSLSLTGVGGIAEYVANNQAIEYANASGTFAPTLGVSNSNVLYIRPGSSAAYTQLQDYGGTSLLQLGDTGIVGANIPVTLANTLTVTGLVTTNGGHTNVGTLTETGNQTISGTLGVTGVITATAGVVATPPGTVTAAAAGSTTLITNSLNTFSASGTLSSYTLTFPTSPAQGTEVEFVFNQTVTTLTLTAAQGINGNIATVAGSTPKAFVYVGGSWWPAP